MNEIEKLLSEIDDLEWGVDESQSEIKILKQKIERLLMLRVPHNNETSSVVLLSPKRFKLYNILKKSGTGITTTKHLASKLNVSHSYMKILLKDLVLHGLLEYGVLNGKIKGIEFRIILNNEFIVSSGSVYTI